MKIKTTLLALAVGSLFALSGTAFAEVKIQGKNEQMTDVKGAVVNTAAGGKTTATQNLSSNKGNVDIGGNNKQTTLVKGAVINTAATGWSKAEQNLSSNDGD